ncbi:MAG: choice-of-anchor B family protein [Candidatus Promineifilaceae bacterium]
MLRAKRIPHPLWLALLGAGLAVFLGLAWLAPAGAAGATPCVGGMAGPYPCQNIDLLGQLTLPEMGAGPETLGNDLWGWTDPLDGKEYVIYGMTDQAAFVDISDPVNPRYLGSLPTHTTSSVYRDMQVYQNHAYIVADQPSLHGMQIFDLTELRGVVTPTTFTETAYYGDFGNGHNLFINQDTGFAYVMRTEQCSGAFYMLDLQEPLNPAFAGCFHDDGLTSDTQCVVYAGPDADYAGRELCFTGSDDAFTVGDVTDKAAPVQLARLTYPGIERAHQGWLTEDHAYFLLSDIDDEHHNGHNTRTHLWNVADLDAIQYMGYHEFPSPAVDHNLFIKGAYVYEANFRNGLRILDIFDLENGVLNEVAYFDTDPAGDSPTHNGAWSSYIWFESGTIAVSNVDQNLGLMLLQATLPGPTSASLSGLAAESNPAGFWRALALLPLLAGLLWLTGRRLKAR